MKFDRNTFPFHYFESSLFISHEFEKPSLSTFRPSYSFKNYSNFLFHYVDIEEVSIIYVVYQVTYKIFITLYTNIYIFLLLNKVGLSHSPHQTLR